MNRKKACSAYYKVLLCQLFQLPNPACAANLARPADTVVTWACSCLPSHFSLLIRLRSSALLQILLSRRLEAA